MYFCNSLIKNYKLSILLKEELANFVTFLTSDYCSWVNGQVINFDGGEGNFRAGQMNELSFLPDSFWSMIKK